jgi:acyl carrier protein
MNKKLAEILSDVFQLSVVEIQLELRSCDVGTWDSLKQMDLVMSLERQYNIELNINDIVRMTSVGEIVTVLKEKGVTFED